MEGMEEKLFWFEVEKGVSNFQQWFYSIDFYPLSINLNVWPSDGRKCYSLNDKVFSHPRFKFS